jgi:teichuronic acid biosynthesis glycosyltransferase TuaC
MGSVVCVSHMFPNPAALTAGTFVADPTSALLELGVNMKVICPIPAVPLALSHVKRKWAAYYGTPRAAIVGGVPTRYARWLCLPYRRAFADSGRLMANGLLSDRRVRRELAEATLLHGHTLLPDGDCVRRLALKLGLRYVVTVHGSDLTIYPFRDRGTFVASKRVMDDATEIIFVSQYLADFAVSRFGIDCGKVRVIGNGFDPKVFHPGWSPPENSLRFLYVGDLKREKGLLDLVQAIQQFRASEPELFKRADFTFAGEGADRTVIEAAIVSTHLEASIHVLGEVPHIAVADHMRTSDFLVLPSWSEGLPTVIPEALACGLPIIATTVGGIPEVVCEANGYLVAPKKPSELAGALAQVARRAWDRDAVTDTSRPYTWSSLAKRIKMVYEDAIGTNAKQDGEH